MKSTIAILLLSIALAWATEKPKQTDPPKIDKVDALEIQNIQLRMDKIELQMQSLQVQFQALQMQKTAEQGALNAKVEDVYKRSGVDKTKFILDPTTQQFRPAPEPEKKEDVK